MNMQGRTIDHPDDLVPGRFVTVVACRVKDAPAPRPNPFSSMFGDYYEPSPSGAVDRRLYGAVLRVCAVSLPFVALTGAKGRRHVLDLREVTFAPLTEAFVKAMVVEEKALDANAITQEAADTFLRCYSRTMEAGVLGYGPTPLSHTRPSTAFNGMPCDIDQSIQESADDEEDDE